MLRAVTALAPGWLAAVVPEGLLFASEDAIVEAEFELPRASPPDELLAGVLGSLDDPSALAERCGVERAEAIELAGHLNRAGATAVGDAPAAPSSTAAVPLVEAVVTALDTGRSTGGAFTASELLVLPAEIEGRALRRTLRAFIAGFESHARVRGYGQVALTGKRVAAGDVPTPDRLGRALDVARELDSSAIHVVALADCSVESLPGPELDELGAREVHRLGTVPSVDFTTPVDDAPAPFELCTARHAHPNLRHPGRRHSWTSGMAPDREEALVIARAEAAERYACGDLSDRDLVRATEDELDAPHLPPDTLFLYRERQYLDRWEEERYVHGEPRLWFAAATASGERSWVAAANVFYPFVDPELPSRLPPVTSSGVAAHAGPKEARQRALRELIERDAFMWTWLQRVSREHLNRDSLGPAVADRARALERSGYTVDFVNLTLDSKPVVMCAVRDDRHLSLSAACREDPVTAAARALAEASAILWFPSDEPEDVVETEAVLTPEDHLRLYRDPAVRAEADFLFASPDTIDAREVARADGPVESAVRAIAEPHFVELDCPGSRPFSVVRALVPGLVPISFGFDREPLGLPRVAEAKTLVDGRRLAAARDPGDGAPILPHPFP